MQSRIALTFFFAVFFSLSLAQGPPKPPASTGSTTSRRSTTIATVPTSTSSKPLTGTTTTPAEGATTTSDSPGAAGSTPPDVYLNVPNLSVGRIELDVENLQADINLNAAVAG